MVPVQPIHRKTIFAVKRRICCKSRGAGIRRELETFQRPCIRHQIRTQHWIVAQGRNAQAEDAITAADVPRSRERMSQLGWLPLGSHCSHLTRAPSKSSSEAYNIIATPLGTTRRVSLAQLKLPFREERTVSKQSAELRKLYAWFLAETLFDFSRKWRCCGGVNNLRAERIQFNGVTLAMTVLLYL